jgi:seryl-tRNA synthetase
MESYQTNRLKCRFKDSNGKTQLVHSLNGSSLALPRILASILENNQTENGIKFHRYCINILVQRRLVSIKSIKVTKDI